MTPSTTRPDSRSLDLRAPRSGTDAPPESRTESSLLPPVLRGRWEQGRTLEVDAVLQRLREDGPAFAWFTPDGDFVAGFGAVARFEGSGPGRFQAAKSWLDGLDRAAASDEGSERPPLIAVGGFSFAEGSAGSPAGFGDAVFFVPAEIWTSGPDGGFASWRRADGEAAAIRPAPPLARPPVPEWTEREWSEGVRAVLDEIAAGPLQKAVLARAVEIESSQEIDPSRVLESLIEANPACYRFLVRPAAGASFVGASPERLVARLDHIVVSDAVAGTAADAAVLEAGDNGKDRSEHAFVVRHIVEALQPLCDSITADPEPSLQRHRRLTHLKTRISGHVRARTHVLDFAERVHPTPAVAGSPLDAALALIRALEPSNRGWYAGAVGWMDADGRGDFTVGIRSALIHGSRALLFAGAGIVPGSDPAAEWAETEIKLSVMREAIADAGR
ncbi:MAG TPA: isochorismate synthase [Candidatus Limnocylindrales bacterium]|nr:isochorismate synthase [Candidatus Limnocylindrales bacterium]